MNAKILVLGIVLLIAASMAGFAKAEPLTIMAGQAKAITVELSNTKSVTETLNLSVVNDNPDIQAEVEQKVLSLRPGEKKTVNVLVRPLAEAREGTYFLKLVGKKIVTMQPEALQAPLYNQPFNPTQPVYGQPQPYGEPLPPMGLPPGRRPFRPLAAGQPPLVPDTGGLDLDGALSIEASLSNPLDAGSVALGVRNELFRDNSGHVNISQSGNTAFVEFTDDFFEKQEIVPVSLSFKDRRGNDYRLAYAFNGSTLALADPRLAIRINELGSIDPSSLRVEVRSNEFGGSFIANTGELSFNPASGELVLDLRGIPFRVGERMHFSVTAKDFDQQAFNVSGNLVLDFDDRLVRGETLTGDTAKDFVATVDRQKYQDYMAYKRAVVDPYINIRNEFDRARRQYDIEYANYYGTGIGPLYQAPAEEAQAPDVAYFQDAAAGGYGSPYGLPPMEQQPFGQGMPYGQPQPYGGTPVSQELPRETVREEIVFEQDLAFRVVKAPAPAPVPAPVAPAAAKAKAKAAPKPEAVEVQAKASAGPVPVKVAENPASGFVSLARTPMWQSAFLGLVALLLLAMIAGMMREPSSIVERSYRRRAMHVIRTYKK